MIADVFVRPRNQMHFRDLSAVTLGILGVGVIGEKSESFLI